MNIYDDLDGYEVYSNPYIVNYNYNTHNVDIIESIDVIFDQFTDDEFTDDEYGYEQQWIEEEAQRTSIETIEQQWIEEEAQRMSIETINLTQQIINGEIEIELEPINLIHEIINEQIEQPRQLDNEIINSYLSNGDELIETCSICLDDVEHIESTSKISCGHHFHTSCIRLCLERNNKCPLCRQYCLIN